MQAARGTPLTGTESTADAAASAPGALRTRKLGVFAIVAASALSADVLSKALVVAHLDPARPRRLLGGGVYLTLVRNSGAAFSVGAGATFLFTAIAVVIAGLIIRVSRRLRSTPWAIALGLVLGGALGNLIDRIFRAPGWGRGHVVDWISLFAPDGHVWPIFNLADSVIDCGGVLGGVLLLMGIGFDGRRSRSGSGTTPSAPTALSGPGAGSDGSP